MTSNIIDLSAYRRSVMTSSPPAEAFVADYDCLNGYVFGTIDAEGRRTVHRTGLSLSEAAILLTDPVSAIARLGA